MIRELLATGKAQEAQRAEMKRTLEEIVARQPPVPVTTLASNQGHQQAAELSALALEKAKGTTVMLPSITDKVVIREEDPAVVEADADDVEVDPADVFTTGVEDDVVGTFDHHDDQAYHFAMVTRRVLRVKKGDLPEQRENLYHTSCSLQDASLSVIIDGGRGATSSMRRLCDISTFRLHRTPLQKAIEVSGRIR